MRILIISAIHRKLNYHLQCRAMGLAHRAIALDTHHEFGLWLDFREEPSKDEEASPWSRLCRVADKAVSGVDLTQWDFVLWVDADVVEYPPDVCSRLLSVNPTGITAPLPLIQDTQRLYDVAACIMDRGDNILPNTPGSIPGRNLSHEAPYWPEEPTTRFVEMDCVGMMLLIPAHILKVAGVPDHPAFTGWYGACTVARLMGLPVGIDRETVAQHADLPKFGTPWH